MTSISVVKLIKVATEVVLLSEQPSPVITLIP